MPVPFCFLTSTHAPDGINDSEIKWATLHSEQDRINKEKEELRKTMLVLAKAKSERKATREDLIARVSARRQELEQLIAENEEKRLQEEERRREMSLQSVYDDYGPGTYNEAEDESYDDSNVSIFGSFGRSSSESGYAISEGEDDYSEDRWG